MINSIAFYEFWPDMAGFFTTFDDVLNSLVAMFYTIAIVVFPLWCYSKIKKHYSHLNDK